MFYALCWLAIIITYLVGMVDALMWKDWGAAIIFGIGALVVAFIGFAAARPAQEGKQ